MKADVFLQLLKQQSERVWKSKTEQWILNSECTFYTLYTLQCNVMKISIYIYCIKNCARKE